jgi:hypothetical protein
VNILGANCSHRIDASNSRNVRAPRARTGPGSKEINPRSESQRRKIDGIRGRPRNPWCFAQRCKWTAIGVGKGAKKA